MIAIITKTQFKIKKLISDQSCTLLFYYFYVGIQTCAANANLCQNFGTCTDVAGVGIKCSCGWYYTGTYCDKGIFTLL